jgi:hypothetical protein
MLMELNLAGKLTLVDGDDRVIIPGIKVFTGSRHTFNSQYALVNTGRNKIILASDNIWVYYNIGDEFQVYHPGARCEDIYYLPDSDGRSR